MPTRTIKNRSKEQGSIQSVFELMRVVEKEGFLPFWKNDIPGFSLEEKTMMDYSPERKKLFDHWAEWILEEREAVFGHFFAKGIGFVSKELFPYLAAYKRADKDFKDLQIDQDTIAGKVMAFFYEKESSLAFGTEEEGFQRGLAKQYGAGKAVFSEEEIKAYTEREAAWDVDVHEVLLTLSQATYLCTGKVQGEYFFSRPESLYGRPLVTRRYGKEDPFSFIVHKVQENYPEATPEMVEALIGKGRVSPWDIPELWEEGVAKKREEDGGQGEEDLSQEAGPRIKRNRTYPFNLIGDVFEINQSEDISYSKECLDALEEALGKLDARQVEIVRCRYQEIQIYQTIADRFGISKERVRQILKSSVEKLRTPAMRQAFTKVIESSESRQAKEEGGESLQRTKKNMQQYTRMLAVPAPESLERQELLASYELSNRCVRCLQRHGYYTVGQLLWLYQKDPSFETIHNFGLKSREEVLELFRSLNLVASK